MYKSLIFSFIIAIFLTACGGGGGSSTTTNATSTNQENGSNNGSTTQGIAVDPYIEGATFFWDKNKNGVQDDDEPLSSKSDVNGKFSFNVKLDANARVVMKDKGEHNGVPYTGTLFADLGENGVVSPLTTFEAKYPQSDIVTLLSNTGIIINQADIHKDPMNNENKTVNLTVATIALDTFLKLDSDNNIVKSGSTLSDIIDTTKDVLNNDISDDNIKDLVKFVDRLVLKSKKDNSLDELTKLKNDTNYKNNVKNTLANMTSLEVQALSELSTDGTSATYHYPLFDNKVFAFSSIPQKGTSTTLSLNLDGDTSSLDITWQVEKEPTSSALTLSTAFDKKSVSFTPSVPGEYTVKVVAQSANAQAVKHTTFYVKDTITFETSNVSSINSSTNNDEKIGIVKNQSWVSSKTLNETQLTNLINQTKYSSLTKKGFDNSKGLLIEYTPNNTSKEALAFLKLETGVDKVYNRVYAGDNAYKSYAIYPDDNGNFNDGGSNWHLEVTNMPEAWEYTQGSDKFLLGVSDGGYDTLHDDLQGRFAAILTSAKHSHGMGVTGSMAAIKDNKKGISGINDVSQVVASYMGGSYVEQVVSTQKDSKEVKVINNSWGYHLPSNFNPTSANVAKTRFENMQNIYAQVRQLVSYYDNKIFVWAAGNGVGNGYSTTGHYGVDAKYENGSIHYKDNMLNKLDNLLVVAAFKQDKKLIYYSSYGQSVDIAAPTHYDSLALNNGKYSSFGGTSAAAPVVTAIASLVYSINPNLTAKEVKSILINSATEYITQRETSPGGSDAYLQHPIPIVNAEEAVKLAQKTITNQVTASSKLTNIISPTLDVTYNVSNINYTISQIDANIQSSTSQGSYTNFSTTSSTSNGITFALDTSKRYHKVDATIKLKHLTTGDIVTQEHTYFYNYSDLTIKTIDNITLQKIPNVSLTINKLASDMNLTYASTNSNGELKIYIDSGIYRLNGSTSGYKNAIKDIFVQDSYSLETELPLTPNNIEKQGSISGFVFDENGIALESALVKISGGALTNGYFASALTDENGYYKLTNLSQKASKDFNYEKIDSFTISVTKSGYVENIREDVLVLEGIERTENFSLITENTIPDNEYIYKNNFEGDVSDWTRNGFWHQEDFSDTITNVNIAKGNVQLAPDDNSSGALPKAKEGTKAFWYGQKSTGNYIGVEQAYIQPGGESTNYNYGTLTSPTISIGDVNATLRFSSWWEIESVNPNTQGFDLLEVYIVEEGKDYSNQCNSKSSWKNIIEDELYKKWGASNWSSAMKDDLIDMEWSIKCGYNYINTETGDLVKKLNPAIDPAIESREKLPFSSAGFNRKPIWTIENIDLSKYRNKNIKIKFKFDTKDTLFNGFRGWIIDDLQVVDKAKLNQ